jgi:hypothetical protein
MPNRWVIRAVKDGAVSIGGRTFRPSDQHMKYDGRLDGQRMAFARYWTGYKCEPFVALWGTEAAFRSSDPHASESGPECIDGILPWYWWYEEEPK